MLCSHLVIGIACIFSRVKYNSGAGNPTALSTCTKIYQPHTFSRWPPARKKGIMWGFLIQNQTVCTCSTTKCSSGNFVLFPPSTDFSVVSISPGFIQEDLLFIFTSICSHSAEIKMPLFNKMRLLIIVTSVVNPSVPRKEAYI